MIPKSDKTPRFNLKAVVRETGLKPDTLRAWERRYGLPEPNRTAGGHRLYSQHDIDLLKWLAARQEEGLSISRAVDLWHQVEAEGKNPLQTYSTLELEFISPSLAVFGSSITDLQQRWLNACMSFDEFQAQQISAEAFALFPVETVCFEVLQKGLATIGQRWHAGEITAQQEHFASALATRQLEALLAAAPPPTRNGRILVACPPQEMHTFSALLITLLLRRRSWDVVYLGANVPTARLESVITAVQPKLAVLCAQTLFTASTTLDMAQMFQGLQVPVAFGGAIFNTSAEIIQRIPGYFLGSNMETAPLFIERLIETPPAPVKVVAIAPDYQHALNHYIDRQSAIEAHLRQTLVASPLSPYLDTVSHEMWLNITAALKLGNMELLQPNLEWLRGLLVNYLEHFSSEAIRSYFHAYHQAAKTCLDERGSLIVTWLSQFRDDR